MGTFDEVLEYIRTTSSVTMLKKIAGLGPNKTLDVKLRFFEEVELMDIAEKRLLEFEKEK